VKRTNKKKRAKDEGKTRKQKIAGMRSMSFCLGLKQAALSGKSLQI
jgi:hypothetical protein